MFVDKVRITVIGGRGGDGAVAFHREKFVASGGPDGGDGGHGGSVILRVDDNMTTLLDFRYKRKYQAGSGVNGMGRKMSGKRGEPLIIKVPRGTVVRDAESGQIIVDMSTGEDFVIAKGGRGGWGNSHYATATRQVPRFAKSGRKGEEKDIVLELKLLADVGLVGFPNVGKSTLLSVTSNARPKIANYHFTTLFPNLGVIYVEEGVSFVMADIPGIIEGAAEGAGLGHDFLRHIDRCRLLVHVVDVSGSEARDPVEDFDAICAELKNYSVDLSCGPVPTGNPGPDGAGGHDPGGLPAPAPGVLSHRGNAGSRNGSSAAPPPPHPPADGAAAEPSAAGGMDLDLLRPVPGRSADRILSRHDGRLRPLGMVLWGSCVLLVRDFLAFRCKTPC